MEDKNAREEREQLLALNQVLARQVMERSRLVAGRVIPPPSLNHVGLTGYTLP